jgi:hypothetical protein
MDNIQLNLVPLKHSLKQSAKFQSISNAIVERLKEVPEIEQCKLSLELISFVCNLIEYYAKHKYKINKQSLLIFTLKRVVSLSEEEEKLIRDSIEYLHVNGLIKSVSKVSFAVQYLKNALKKRF